MVTVESLYGGYDDRLKGYHQRSSISGPIDRNGGGEVEGGTLAAVFPMIYSLVCFLKIDCIFSKTAPGFSYFGCG